MKRKKFKKIKELINSLTVSEDFRQQLWVDYLSNPENPSFEQSLYNMQIQEDIYSNHKNKIQKLLLEDLDFAKKINNFSALEREIVFYLVLGFTLDKISKYKGISMVRLRQIIEGIQNSPIW